MLPETVYVPFSERAHPRYAVSKLLLLFSQRRRLLPSLLSRWSRRITARSPSQTSRLPLR